MRLSLVSLVLALLSLFQLAGEGWAQTQLPRVGLLSRPLLSGTQDRWYGPFVGMLAQQGWRDGNSVSLEHRSATGNPPQYEGSAEELVRLKVDVIVTNNAPATRAAFRATHTIPIVGLDYTNDPVAAGYVKAYGRPGGNLTGFFLDAPQFALKWLELLNGMIPRLSRVAVLWDPTPGPAHLKAVQGASQRFGVRLQVIEVQRPDDLESAFSAVRGRNQALIILPSPMMWAESERLAEFATRHRMPATSMAPEFAEAGGLLAYGPDSGEAGERCAILVAKILSGAKPADLPVERPGKFNLVVNLNAAKALALTVPDGVLISADRVIR
jgi:ABC-type uncharacterized transport system substrate-binding protein